MIQMEYPFKYLVKLLENILTHVNRSDIVNGYG